MRLGLRLFLLAGLLLLAGGPVQAASNLNFTSPVGFFTNFAPRLLASYFGAPANVSGGTNLLCYGPGGSLQFNIEIYPVNYYTPAVHRLLQLTANLYDATTNSADLSATLPANEVEPCFPHVFQPMFYRDANNNIFITNYVEVVGTGFLFNPICDVNDPGSMTNPSAPVSPLGVGSGISNNVYGIPLIIGARNGFPNFNQFAMQDDITVSRRLQFVRGNWPATPITQTNVMYDLSVSAPTAIQAWNSYGETYPRNLQMTAVVDLEVALMTTNAGGVPITLYTNDFAIGYTTNISASNWLGYPTNRIEIPSSVAASFVISLYTNNLYSGSLLTNCTYLQNNPGLTNLQSTFEVVLSGGKSAFPVPRWWYQQKTRMRYILIDTSVSPNRIVDYASLSHVENPVDVTYGLQLNGDQPPVPTPQGGETQAYAEWTTNRLGARTTPSLNNNPTIMTVGMFNQIAANLGEISVQSADWVSDAQAAGANDIASATTFFQDNFNYNPGIPTSVPPPDLTNVFYTPFDPIRAVVQSITWQANDPLVHYTVGDLVSTNSGDAVAPLNFVQAISPSPLPLMPGTNVTVNARYQPWGGNPNKSGAGANDFNIAVKDPLITRSDDWQFPTNGLPGIGWIGQVHRGSPWQTVYLKPALGTNVLASWTNWAGDSVITDLFTVPSDSTDIANAQTNGWLVFLSSNAVPRVCVDGALSVPTNDWQAAALLDILLNTNNPQQLLSVNDPNTNDWQAAMDGFQVSTPTGIFVLTSNSPQAAIIAAGIQAMRSTNYNGSFKQLGDILSVPVLTVASPCLGGTPNLGQGTTLNDAMLESIPLQLLPLLRPDSIGSISQNSGGWQVQFTGMDGFGYGLETSSDLLNWVTVTTNYPFDGIFNFTDPAPVPGQRFYRSVLLP